MYEVTSVHAGSYKFIFNGEVSVGRIIPPNLPEEIAGKSPSFRDIYIQANIAEQYGLLEICGVGYRKALEFLIKDYCIELQPDAKDNILKGALAKVIDTYVKEPKIKDIAKRAVWLGNDETHYVRKWGDKDLRDLKMLIDMTIYWIVMETLSRRIKVDMPDPS